MTKKQNKYLAWALDIDTVLEIMELAKKHGKKPGDSMQDEFVEILKKKRHRFKLMGMSDKDIDLLIGNLRESGLKVFSPNEKRRSKKDEDRIK